MQILTPMGYTGIDYINEGDDLVAFDFISGGKIINKLLDKKNFTKYNEIDNYNHGDFIYYVINSKYRIYKNQSIWRNISEVVHAYELEIGDIIYDDNNNDILINTISTEIKDDWWKLSVSGDHSFIADGLTLHNASRFWVGGGSTTNWTATAPTNWASTSGGANNASVPTAADDVTFDGVGLTANGSCVTNSGSALSVNQTSGYTGSILFNGLNISGNFTLGANATITGSSNTNVVTTGTGSWTSNGKTLPCQINFNLSSITITLLDDFTVSGGNTGVQFQSVSINGANLILIGTTPLIPGGIRTLSGTGGLILKDNTSFGDLSVSHTINIPITINSTGTVNYKGSVTTNSTITYLAGTVSFSTGANLTLGNCILNTAGMTWNNVTIGSNIPFTFSSTMSSNNLTLSGSATFSGPAGFIVGNLISTATTAAKITLLQGNDFIIRNYFNCASSRVGSVVSFTSSSSTQKANLILLPGATCSVLANFTRINSNGGRTIWTFNGSVTECFNINSFNRPNSVGLNYI